MAEVIIPKTYVKDIGVPIIFLAGPIRSAPAWHDSAIESILLLSRHQNITIASPNEKVGDGIKPHLIAGDDDRFPRQRAWERYYLDLASKTGAIMFWLPGEESHSCQKAYGAMTRIELGQWMTNYRHDRSVRMCIGSDGKFSELDTIRYDLSIDAPDKKIFGSLEETCFEAVRIALRK